MPRSLELAASLLWTAALLGALEVGLRLGGFRYAHYPVSMRYVSSIARAGAEQTRHQKRFRVDYALDHELLWRPIPAPGVTNSEGFIGPEWRREKDGRRRLIALGDSCTVAGEDPYPSVLSRSLPGWEVLNAGVGSWSSYQGLRLLRGRLLAYRPDAVTVYFGWNDHWLAWAAPDKELSALLDRQWKVLRLIERSRLLQALLKAADALRGGAAPKDAEQRPPRVSEDDYEANLRSIVAAAGEAGARPILVTAPSGLTPDHPTAVALCRQTLNFSDPSRLPAVHAAYNSRVRRVAKDTGASLVDLEAAFARRRDQTDLYTDGIHLSAKGHSVAAALLREALR